MRTIIDIPEEQVKALDRLGNRQKISRAEIIRRAVADYLVAGQKREPGPLKNDIRGLVKAGDPNYFDGLDGVEYQRRIRAEWDHRDKMYGEWGMHDQPQAAYEPLKKPDNAE